MIKKIGLILLVLVSIITALYFTDKKTKFIQNQLYDNSLDSLFYGVRFGMPQQAFYDHCTEMNSKKIFYQGNHNVSVIYIDSINFKKQVDMNFYPDFNDNKVVSQMGARFNYNAWAPWNKELQSVELAKEVAALCEKWYNVKMELKQVSKTKVGYFSIVGPRKISVFTKDEQFVNLLIENKYYK